MGRPSNFKQRMQDAMNGNRFKTEKKEFVPRYQNRNAQDNRPSNYQKSFGNDQQNNRKTFKANYTIECYQCKKKGHYKRNCPQVRSANTVTEAEVCTVNIGNGSSIPNSIVKVENQDVLAYFDTGAECSVISAKNKLSY